jgi:hypothetical protein
MAALDLVSEVASDAPLLLVVEDAQWLDGPTSEVLAFVARRIESDPIVLLVAIRDGYRSVLGDAGLPEHRLAGLDDATAPALLDASAPQLSPAARTRVLREAAGNPLALIELPAVLGQHEDGQWLPGGLPLTERLERAFAARASGLPDASRLFLRVAALNDGDAVGEVLQAAWLRLSVCGSQATPGEVAAPSRMGQSAELASGPSQVVRVDHLVERHVESRSSSDCIGALSGGRRSLGDRGRAQRLRRLSDARLRNRAPRRPRQSE